jgi:hypothetical protein
MKSIAYISDAVEFRVWAADRIYTLNDLKDDLKAAIDPEEYSEDVLQNVIDEMQERQKLLGDSYPFECDGYSLRPRGVSPSRATYIFCLGLSLLPPALIENDQRAVQFETIAMVAASKFFNGKPLRIGAPWKNEQTREYRDLLDRVVELIPELGKGTHETAPDGGDGGWDVLIVKDFADRKIPRFIVLGNCATGLTNWKRKGKETEPDYIWTFFAHTPRSVVITFFAVPFIMDQDARLRRTSSSSLTFDRYRICEHAPTSSQEAADWLESTRESALQVAFN